MSETSLTLYDVESNLQAFTDTEEGGISDEQRAEFESELSVALAQAVEKRDHFAQFIRMSETLAAATGEEIKRLQARKKRLEAQAERAKEFGAKVILNLGPDAKGRYRKLEGKTATLAVRKNPDAVQITNERLVPDQYQISTFTIAGEAGETLMRVLLERRNFHDDENEEVLAGIKGIVTTVDKRAIKAAIDAGEQVPGADVAFGSYRLVVS